MNDFLKEILPLIHVGLVTIVYAGYSIYQIAISRVSLVFESSANVVTENFKYMLWATLGGMYSQKETVAP